MKEKSKVCFMIASLLILMSACATTPENEVDPLLVGVWQYRNFNVWIQIEPNGDAFQCRRGKDFSIWCSRGRLKDGVITWEEVWEPDKVEITWPMVGVKPWLTLSNSESDSIYHEAYYGFVGHCRNPLPQHPGYYPGDFGNPPPFVNDVPYDSNDE